MTEVTQDPAETALSVVMNHVVEGARPWSVAAQDLENLASAFRPDFQDVFKTQADVGQWARRLRRLFGKVGSLAAKSSAERRQRPNEPAGQVEWDDLVSAVWTVREADCPSDDASLSGTTPAGLVGRVCRRVPFLQGRVRRDVLVGILAGTASFLGASSVKGTEKAAANDLALLALRQAMEDLGRAADPWTIDDGDITWLKGEFNYDFGMTIETIADYDEWRPRLERLFVHSGRLAAFLAEAARAQINVAPGKIPRQYLVLALQVVKVALCYSRFNLEDRLRRAKACKTASFMQDPQLATAKAVVKAALGFGD